MNKVTYFDVEYANSKNKSICQIGIMCEDFNNGEPFYPELNIYVNPEDGFDNNCIRIHGITADRVKDEDNFPIVWKEIEKYFTNAVVVGHNVASADLDALVKMLNRYNLDVPELYYVCTYELAKQFVPSYLIQNYSMSTLCDYFGIDIDSEHDAFDDACACSDLFKQLIDEFNIDVDVDALKEQINSVDGKTVCLSGNFAYGQKSQVEKYIIEHGGTIDSSLKKTTDILMIGDNECQAYSNGKYGTKVKKAMEYNEKGCNISIIKECDFFSNVK